MSNEKAIDIGRCPGPGIQPTATDWYCDGNACKAGGNWQSCKTAIEARGYKLVFTQDAKAEARSGTGNITDSEGKTYGV